VHGSIAVFAGIVIADKLANWHKDINFFPDPTKRMVHLMTPSAAETYVHIDTMIDK
jgi:hypothetical protein